MAIRILLVDDHKIIRDGLRALIGKHPEFELAGEADNGTLAVEMAGELKPDVVIMDLSLPKLNGIEATQRICRDFPEIRVIALSMHSDKRFIVGMLNAGARAYLMKECSFEELHCAIRAVIDGNKFLSPEITSTVIDDYLRQISFYSDPYARCDLTARESEVLKHIAEGCSTRQVADLLEISVKTVESHRQNIMDKLEARSVAELTKYAIRLGLTTLNA